MKLGRYFGLVSITGLMGLITTAACSNPMTDVLEAFADAGPGGSLTDAKTGKPSRDPDDDDDKKAPDDDDEDPGNNGNPVTKKDAGKEAGPGPGPSPDPSSCLDPTPINATLFPYKTAGVTPGACTTAELTTLSSYFKTQTDNGIDPSTTAWAAQVSANCAKCVFSDGTGPTWTPILTSNDKLSNVNRGSCIEIKSGKQSCGRAYQQTTECRLAACTSLCQTQAEFDDCLFDAQGIFGPNGPCEATFNTLQVECGAGLGTYEDACKSTMWTFEAPIRAQCITGN